MIVFRFDDLITIGNNVVNMPCGSPCRFLISKGGDSSASVVLTSGGNTLSATTSEISPFSTDDYTGFDIITPADPANIPYHAVITGTNETRDIDIILNAKRSTVCGDLSCTVKIDDLDSIGSRGYTFPTNSYIGLEVEIDGAFSFSDGVFPSQSNVPSTNTQNNIQLNIPGVFSGCSKTQILTPSSVGVFNAVATVEELEKTEDGVYSSEISATRFTGYNENDEAEYLIDVYPKENISCSRILNGEVIEITSRYVNVVIQDMQENVLASAPYFFMEKTGNRPATWNYYIDNSQISGEWKDYYPYKVRFFSRTSSTEPATPTYADTTTTTQPDGKTSVSCVGETKYSYVFKPTKQFNITITTKDTGFSYSK